MTTDLHQLPAMLKPSQMAEILGVDPKTLARWAKSGRIPCSWTLGGHRRYSRDLAIAILAHQGSGVQDENMPSLSTVIEEFTSHNHDS